jgi:hypothetical protein
MAHKLQKVYIPDEVYLTEKKQTLIKVKIDKKIYEVDITSIVREIAQINADEAYKYGYLKAKYELDKQARDKEKANKSKIITKKDKFIVV